MEGGCRGTYNWWMHGRARTSSSATKVSWQTSHLPCVSIKCLVALNRGKFCSVSSDVILDPQLKRHPSHPEGWPLAVDAGVIMAIMGNFEEWALLCGCGDAGEAIGSGNKVCDDASMQPITTTPTGPDQRPPSLLLTASQLDFNIISQAKSKIHYK